MKKNQIRALKQLAAKLPISYELKPTSLVRYGYEFSIEEIEQAGIVIEAEKLYTSKRMAVELINHDNRLQKAFARNKEQGLIDYIYWVDKNNKKMNALSEKLQLEQVSQDLKDIAEKGSKGFWSNLTNFLLAFIAIFKPGNKAKSETL